MFDVVGVLIVLVLLLVFGFLAMRAWRARNALVKWVGGILASLLTLLLLIVLVVALIGFYKLNVAQAAPPATVKVQGTPEQVARGEKLANLCVNCHSTSNHLPLDGALANFLEQGPPAGVIQPPNLTPAGSIKDWSDGEIIRAIRDGVHRSGRPLLIMPSAGFHGLGDADAQALVAYLRSQPPTPHPTAPTNVNIIAALLVGGGLFPTSAQPPTTQPINAPPAGVTAEYGNYLVGFAGCRDCHGNDLGGGTPNQFGPPAGPNLTQILPKWSDADFIKLIRTGIDPAGHKIDPGEMPYPDLSNAFSDDELKAIFTYVKSVPPINRAVPTMQH